MQVVNMGFSVAVTSDRRHLVVLGRLLGELESAGVSLTPLKVKGGKVPLVVCKPLSVS